MGNLLFRESYPRAVYPGRSLDLRQLASVRGTAWRDRKKVIKAKILLDFVETHMYLSIKTSHGDVRGSHEKICERQDSGKDYLTWARLGIFSARLYANVQAI